MGPSDTQLSQAFDHSPIAIQESLSEGGAVEFMMTLTKRYGLHADTAGYIASFIRNMLLGFLRPEQFMGKLKSVGLTDEQARKLTGDLNKEVFLPLRDEIRSAGTPMATRIPHVPVMQVNKEARSIESVSAVTPTQASEKQPSYNLIPQQPAASAAVSAPTPSVAPMPNAPSPAITAPVPTMRTMQHDMDLVQHGKLPEPFPAPGAQLHPAQATPARMFQTASVPVTTSPAAEPKPEVLHIVPDAAPRLAPGPNPAEAEYTSDPYREPI